MQIPTFVRSLTTAICRDSSAWMLAAGCAGFMLGVGYWRNCQSQCVPAQPADCAQTLPTATDHDGAESFPAGPEFKLSAEAAALAESYEHTSGFAAAPRREETAQRPDDASQLR